MRPVVRAGAVSVVLPGRPALAALGVGVLLTAAVLASLAAGQAAVPPGRVVAALFGAGTPDETLLIHRIRLPRVIAAVLAGAALGAAGCLTQALARNRLATPDLVGIDDGATAAILVTVVTGTTGMIGVWWAGPVGAMLAATLVVLAAGGLGTRGYRVLVVGLGVSVLLGAVTDLALSTRSLSHASAVYAWSLGSFTGRGYSVAVPVTIAVAVLLPFAVLAGRRLAVLFLGEDVAAALGLHVPRVRLFALATAAVLAGLGVGVGGPIAFVALAAPIVAARLAGPGAPPVIGSALLGAVLTTTADTLARTAAPAELPAGVITSILGGPFLLWVLLTDERRS